MKVVKTYLSEDGTPLTERNGVIINGVILDCDCETILVDASEEMKGYSLPELFQVLNLRFEDIKKYVIAHEPRHRTGQTLLGA